MNIDRKNYPRNEEGRLDATELYLRRFMARGLKMKGKKRFSDFYVPAQATHYPIGHGSKPNHAARYQDINEVFPPLQSLFKSKETPNAPDAK